MEILNRLGIFIVTTQVILATLVYEVYLVATFLRQIARALDHLAEWARRQ
jgi:hypothetical protein